MGQAQRIEVLNHKGTKLKLGVEVTTATTAPTNPTPIAGDLWYDTSADENNPVAKTYDGSQWVRIAENAMSLLDADGDTRIQVEETTNDDTIRFDVNGKERMTIASSGTLRVAGIPAVNEVVVIVNSGLETYEAASFDFYNSSNTNGLPASLFNSSFESAGASFHAQRDGSTTADWGIGYSFSEAYQINSIRLRSRTDALGARAGGGEFRLYNNGTLVATSSTYQLSTTNSWGASYSPNVTADEVRYIFPNGDNTSNGDGVLNFSEWEISGQTLATAVSPSMLVEAGNMGIGTTTPSEKLHVNGVTRIDVAGTEVVRIDANGIQGAITDADGDTKIQLEETADEDKLRFDLGGTERLILENKGHLNIRNLNTVIGKDAGGSFTTGTHNIAMGVNALSSSTSGVNNIAIGYDALLDATTADRNIAIGSNALLHNKRGTNGVAIGHDAQRYANDKEGSAWDNKNVAIGYQALRGSTTAADNTGNWNTAIGNQSMRHNTSGIDNTAIGANTLHSNTTGKNNTALGYAALEANTTGESNIAVGDDAGRSVTTGSNNTFLGKGSGNGIATGAANTIVGANVNGLGAGLSNTVIIADGDGNERIYVNSSGNMGIGTTSPNAKMHIKGSLGNNYLMRLENTHASDGEGLLISGKGTTRATPLLQVNGGADGTTTAMRVNANGSVSIGDGATDPNAVLQVRGSVGGNYMMRLENTHASDGEGLVISGKGGAATPLLHINGGTNGSTMVMRVRADGRVGIGTPTPTEELDVVGDIKASGSITPDFVFQKYFTGSSALKADYQFMPLEAVAEFVATHHHLPGVPSATEVAQTGGILVNRATEINLEKIEELFLHLIELKEENELLKTRLQSVEKKLGMKN
jgi:hypothetical protein